MIINTLSNIALYQNAYPHFKEVIDMLENTDIAGFAEGRTDISENLYVVAMSKEQSAYTGIMEVHKEWIDVHCTIEGVDTIAYKAAAECPEIEKEYDTENDYMLLKAGEAMKVMIQPDYFCVLDTSMAHAPLVGEGAVRKIVVKVRK